jgi:hypothetical protein
MNSLVFFGRWVTGDRLFQKRTDGRWLAMKGKPALIHIT